MRQESRWQECWNPLCENHHTMSTTPGTLYTDKCIQLQQDECIMSYDVKALFTSVPIGHAFNIIKKHLEQDKELQQRTTMTVNNIICLLKFCLKNIYFWFQGSYYEQLEEPTCFMEHINSIDQCIKFTGEDSRTDGSMPLLVILVIP